MKDFNVVVTVREHAFHEAAQLLRSLGHVQKTGFFNVLLARVDDPRGLLERVEHMPNRRSVEQLLSRVVPLDRVFSFRTPEEFEAKAKEAVAPLASALEGKTFFVRVHRRGFKGRLSSQQAERALDTFLLCTVRSGGNDAAVGFDDPDVVIAIEIVGTQAGLSIWSREELRRFPLLGLDGSPHAATGT